MRKKGQHFLVDRNLLDRIVNYADLVRDDNVLEIGPGTGNLTELLAKKAGRVYAVEVDPDLAAGLQGRFSNVVVIKGDALKVDLPDYNKIVSNLPYQISSRITYRLLSRSFDLAVLMYQREFARRMASRPGEEDYGRLGMVVGYLCHAEILEAVPRSAFRPAPEVESMVVRLMPRKHEVDADRFIKFAGGLFANRRKMVKKAIITMGVSREKLARLDSSQLEKRPEELWPEEAAGLAAVISKG